jgi:anti-sigma regulatory factor (Ser/Thr protein kinase)
MQQQPAELELPRHPRCGARARRWLEQQIGHSADESTLDDLKLVATELVDNAYLHGRGRIVLKLLRTTDAFRVEVIDQGEAAVIEIREAAAEQAAEQPAGPACAERLEEGGRGLMLVDAISSAWGAYEGTTHVWAEVPDGATRQVEEHPTR